MQINVEKYDRRCEEICEKIGFTDFSDASFSRVANYATKVIDRAISHLQDRYTPGRVGALIDRLIMLQVLLEQYSDKEEDLAWTEALTVGREFYETLYKEGKAEIKPWW